MAGRVESLDEDEVISEINVTPLVDVILVLLIIFMITAPAIYQSAIKVQLPKAASGEEAQKSPLQFTIDRTGEIAWGEDKIGWEELTKRLGALGRAASEQTAMISADQATAHGAVIKLMDALRQAGLTRFALNVDGPAVAPKDGPAVAPKDGPAVAPKDGPAVQKTSN